MEEPRDKNSLTKLWCKVGQNALMINRLNEFLKLIDIAVTAVWRTNILSVCWDI